MTSKRLQQLLLGLMQLIRETWRRLTGWDQASAEAMQWVMRLHSCTDLGPLLPEFRRWLGLRAVNRDRFVELWDIWLQLGTLKDPFRWREPSPSKYRLKRASESGPFPWRRAIGLIAGAGVCFGIFYVGLHARMAPQQHLATGVQSTAAGESRQLTTIDGSTIALHELTQVSLDFRADRRHVQLDHGEARFNVVKNTQTPFEVSVDDATTIRAVGTAFWVRRGPEGGRVVVDEGAIDLLVDGQPSLRVSAGESAEFEKDMIRLTQSVASQKVMLIFRGKPLSDAALEFNRHNAKLKILVDEDIGQRGVRGQFLVTNPQGFAATVSLTWRMKCSISRDSDTGTETIHLSTKGAQRPPHGPRAHVC